MHRASGKRTPERRRAKARWPVALVAMIGVSFASSLSAQETTPPAPRFAAGVLTTIPPDLEPRDTVSTHDVVEIRSNPAVEWQPEFLTASRTLHGMSQGVKFRRDIYCLEFSFKPLRMVRVGNRLVWYLVYKVRNTGEVLQPVEGEHGVFTAQKGKGGPVRFVPSFVLESQDRTAAGERIEKAYLDRVIPAALNDIRQREMRGGELLTSVEMAEVEIPVSNDRTDRGVWGVAMWEGVDPRIDFFSVYVGGLTNAYRWTDTPGVYKPGDPPGRGRRFERKALQLNFWRPGDELLQDEREIRYGVPVGRSELYGVEPGVAYRWVYR